MNVKILGCLFGLLFATAVHAVDVRFLAFDERAQALKVKVVRERDGGTLIGDLHPFKRSKRYPGPGDANTPLKLLLDGKTNPDGTPAPLEVKLGSMTAPLVLLMENPKAVSGLAAVAIEDNEANFKWGTYKVFNAAKDDLVMRVNTTNFRIPMGWTPVDITPPQIAGPSAVELRPMKDPKTVVYSSVWQGSADIRRLVIIVPSPDMRLGMYLPKVIPEDRTNIANENAAERARDRNNSGGGGASNGASGGSNGGGSNGGGANSGSGGGNSTSSATPPR